MFCRQLQGHAYFAALPGGFLPAVLYRNSTSQLTEQSSNAVVQIGGIGGQQYC